MFKVRASGVGKIMTDPRTKSELLSETCKDYLRCQWIAETYNREKEISTPAIRKGLMNEEQGITMLSEHLGMMLTKNEKREENEFLRGTCDIVVDDTIYDIKCSFDIFSFAKAAVTKDYELQLQAYMTLWEKPLAALVYVLTDTPDSIIMAEAKSICWKLQDDSGIDEIYQLLKKKMTYSDIPQASRIKVFDFGYDADKVKAIKERVELCRPFYEALTL